MPEYTCTARPRRPSRGRFVSRILLAREGEVADGSGFANLKLRTFSIFGRVLDLVKCQSGIIRSPNLNTNGVVRKYTILGKESLTDTTDWAPTNSTHRFFKVKVEMP